MSILIKVCLVFLISVVTPSQSWWWDFSFARNGDNIMRPNSPMANFLMRPTSSGVSERGRRFWGQGGRSGPTWQTCVCLSQPAAPSWVYPDVLQERQCHCQNEAEDTLF